MSSPFDPSSQAANDPKPPHKHGAKTHPHKISANDYAASHDLTLNIRPAELEFRNGRLGADYLITIAGQRVVSRAGGSIQDADSRSIQNYVPLREVLQAWQGGDPPAELKDLPAIEAEIEMVLEHEQPLYGQWTNASHFYKSLDAAEGDDSAMAALFGYVFGPNFNYDRFQQQLATDKES